jgi:ParB family transcriptional regulator, chromosome partitioning protein
MSPARRPGLGRGLGALLPEEAPPAAPAGRPLEVDPHLIDPNPRQPRRSFDGGSLEELAVSIRALGVLQPLLVRADGGRFELVAGERRWRAALLADAATVPVILVDTDSRGSLERALVENLHREDLNPIEEAAAYKQLLEDGGLTQEALARRLGRSRVSITNALRLLDLPTSVQALLTRGRLTAGHGRALLGLEGNPFIERLARRAGDEGLSVRGTEELVRRYSVMAEGSRPGRRGRDEGAAATTEVQRHLAAHLQTRVRVESGKRKGRVIIDFTSLEELRRVTGVILGESPGGTPSVVRPD